MEVKSSPMGYQPYLYLVYLGTLLFQPIFGDRGAVDWLWMGALIIAFVPAYFTGFLAKGPLASVAIGWMALLGVVSLAFELNSGGSVFLVYAAAAAPYAWSIRTSVRFLVALLLLVTVLALISPASMPYRLTLFLPAYVFVPLIGVIQIFEAERERSNARLRRAHDEVERLAAVAERERIARDLHDLLGHTLSVIRVKSELAGRLVTADPERARAEIDGVERTAREALAEVRAAVAGYRSTGLTGEVVAAKLALEAAGVAFSFRAESVALPAPVEAALGFVLREAVTNVVRHAGASRCGVTLTLHQDRVELAVEDNGVGSAEQEGNGLSTLRERIRALGGRVTVRSAPGQGFTVRAGVPLPNAGAEPSGERPPGGRARLEPT